MEFSLQALPPFSLNSVVHSHGWARLAPFQIIEGNYELAYVLRLSTQQVVQLKIGDVSNGASVTFKGKVSDEVLNEIKSAVRWMLALEDDFSAFYIISKNEPKLHHVEDKAQGRLLRSPTLFEDVIKTILTTNTSWAGTIRMAESLVCHYGEPLPGSDSEFSFPDPGRIARSDEQVLRDETRLGYRAPYVLELARQVDSGSLDLESFKSSDHSSADLHKMLVSIKGVGNYAAAHLMMLLGHYDYLAIDSWALKMVSQEFFDGEPIGPKKVEEIFEPWGEWKGLAYWLWNWSSAK